MPLPFSRRALQTAPSFSRDFAGLKTLDHGVGPAIKFERASDATFFNANGTLQTATNDTPRFDHDPATGASRGLLIEESRTNSLPNSQMTGIAAGSAGTAPTGWSVTGSTNGLTRTIATSIVNGMTVFDVTYSGTVSGGPINITLDPQTTTSGYAASSGQTWTSSVYIAILQGGIPAGATLDLIARGRKSDNTSAGSPADQTVTNITPTSSLTRYSATRTFNSADTAKVTLDIRVTAVPDAASVSFTLRIAAPQLEQGAFPTSYIPTTTAAATRAADSAVVTPISSFYNQSEGTLFAEARFGTPVGSATQVVAEINDNTANNRFRFGRRDSGGTPPAGGILLANTSNGSTDVDATGATVIAQNGEAKIGAGYSTNNFALFVNNSSQVTDTSATPLTAATHLLVGARQGTSLFLNGHIRKIAYWPRRLSNTLLQQLTT